ncbi:hypothetical protein LCGC14_1806540 [marine sediment metagenome]|uniref:DNA (cytosine-5-)-methyltransferase n=1 Tax=marine sediment metagenome TaxID=412755 RepID=A0A0F9GMV6_9ZZZZ
MDNTEEFRCISLCTGYAGIELGLRRVIPNLRTVAYVEREGFACANLVAKIEAGKLDAAPIWTDIKTFDGLPFRQKVHIITGGYPCQPFSVAGKRQGTDDPRHLWPHIARIVSAVRPVWCFFENVSGHLSIGFPEVYRSLRLMGYKVEAGLFTAEEVGAPHKRERLFILSKSINGRCGQLLQQEQKCRGGSSSNIGRNGKIQCMANTSTQRLQKPTRRELRSLPSQAKQVGRRESCRIYAEASWPSRPGQPQYEWEEPRVVDDSRKQKPAGLSSDERQTISEVGEAGSGTMDDSKFRNKGAVKFDVGQDKGEINKHRGTVASRSETKGQAQSRLGRAVNGTASRVDRLRLLGNGVVPQQAELAFRTLLALFQETPK